MFEELKEILLMIAQAGEFTLQAAISLIIAFGIYKLATLASILILIKFTIQKIYDYGIIQKTKQRDTVKYEIRGSECSVADDALFKRLITAIKTYREVSARFYEGGETKVSQAEKLLYSSDMETILKLIEEKNIELQIEARRKKYEQDAERKKRNAD